VFPPDVDDIRPWFWAGYRTGVRYTVVLDTSERMDIQRVEHACRKQGRKAWRSGFRFERCINMNDVIGCLASSERRQGFSYRLSARALECARSLLGDDAFRVYVAYAPDGRAASARVVLAIPGCTALDWVAGTNTALLSSGVTQGLIHHVVDDCRAAGCRTFDFCGANIRSVAASKEEWGGVLKPCFTIEEANPFRYCRTWFRSRARAFLASRDRLGPRSHETAAVTGHATSSVIRGADEP
jgi:hypothetical protein